MTQFNGENYTVSSRIGSIFAHKITFGIETEGKPRHSLSFTPFFGCKRVGLGKNFAETTIKFTVPIIYDYVDFDFVNPEVQINRKD